MSLSRTITYLSSISLILASFAAPVAQADRFTDYITVGSVLGAVAGGALGYQYGEPGSRTKAVSTATGAVLGSMAGYQLQKHRNNYSYQPEYQYFYPEQTQFDNYYRQPVSRPHYYPRPQAYVSAVPQYDQPQGGHCRYEYRKTVVRYAGDDDYMIKQHISDARKRRNMIRNGEADPLELPYDISTVQTSWDDPFN